MDTGSAVIPDSAARARQWRAAFLRTIPCGHHKIVERLARGVDSPSRAGCTELEEDRMSSLVRRVTFATFALAGVGCSGSIAGAGKGNGPGRGGNTPTVPGGPPARLTPPPRAPRPPPP